MAHPLDDLGELVLTYDPAHPQPRFFASGAEQELFARQRASVEPVPWPTGLEPLAAPLQPPPSESAPLPKVDAVVVTWTVAEATALAQLFTPGIELTDWYDYKHRVEQYIPKVTGPQAPFNGAGRYHHSLGLYHPCTIGTTKVLAFKSGLHFAYDGPAMPILDLWNQILDETQCSLLITTGTGGGIGANVGLGDIVIADTLRFECRKTFAHQPIAHEAFGSTALPQGLRKAVTPALLKPNQQRLDNPSRALALIAADTTPGATIVTTDFFGFDDSTDFYKLQGLGQASEMGDATLALALSKRPSRPRWYAIRNASDPQIPNPDDDIQTAAHEAGLIYMKYGLYTSAGSLVATWGTIVSTFPEHKAVSH